MTMSSTRSWLRRTLLAGVFVAAGAATLGSTTAPAQAWCYNYYGYAVPCHVYYYPAYYGHPYWGWGWHHWGWHHWGWHHHW